MITVSNRDNFRSPSNPLSRHQSLLPKDFKKSSSKWYIAQYKYREDFTSPSSPFLGHSLHSFSSLIRLCSKVDLSTSQLLLVSKGVYRMSVDRQLSPLDLSPAEMAERSAKRASIQQLEGLRV